MARPPIKKKATKGSTQVYTIPNAKKVRETTNNDEDVEQEEEDEWAENEDEEEQEEDEELEKEEKKKNPQVKKQEEAPKKISLGYDWDSVKELSILNFQSIKGAGPVITIAEGGKVTFNAPLVREILSYVEEDDTVLALAYNEKDRSFLVIPKKGGTGKFSIEELKAKKSTSQLSVNLGTFFDRFKIKGHEGKYEVERLTRPDGGYAWVIYFI